MAIGGYQNAHIFPANAYSHGMLFASLCSAGLWLGYCKSQRMQLRASSWLMIRFNSTRLFYTGATLSLFGFYFYWKLRTLPEDLLAQGIWSGATTKYLFFANVFKFGFLILGLRYLLRGRWWDVKSLFFLIPSLLFIITTAFMYGRRSEMMNLVSYIVVSLWFCRSIVFPRWIMIGGLVTGIILINGIGIYRFIMMNKELPLSERVRLASQADYISSTKIITHESQSDFNNYITYRQAYAEEGYYDFGGYQWNQVVFNYVPAQIVGSAFKKGLQLPINNIRTTAQNIYGFSWHTGSVSTGYSDAFGSFWWFGALNFVLIGWIMGTLYRYAISGSFLAILLYVYCLSTSMVAITHGTDHFLTRIWIYFFLLCYPFLLWAKEKVTRGML